MGRNTSRSWVKNRPRHIPIIKATHTRRCYNLPQQKCAINYLALRACRVEAPAAGAVGAAAGQGVAHDMNQNGGTARYMVPQIRAARNYKKIRIQKRIRETGLKKRFKLGNQLPVKLAKTKFLRFAPNMRNVVQIQVEPVQFLLQFAFRGELAALKGGHVARITCQQFTPITHKTRPTSQSQRKGCACVGVCVCVCRCMCVGVAACPTLGARARLEWSLFSVRFDFMQMILRRVVC